MSNQSYDQKIISLLDSLTENFEYIVWLLHSISFEESFSKGCKRQLNEEKIKDLQSKFFTTVQDSWNLLNKINQTIDLNIPFEDSTDISSSIVDLVHVCKSVAKSFNTTKESNETIKSFEGMYNSMSKNIKKLSDKIIEYNEKFFPKLITIKKAFKLAEKRNRAASRQLYKEIFGKKLK